MSLNTLIEAAKYLEMQEQIQQQRATSESAMATTTTTIRPVASVKGGNTAQIQNGTSGPTQAITLQPIKLINTSPQSTVANIQTPQPQPTTQTVVISSNNISSTFLQGVQVPITFPATTPLNPTPQITVQNGTTPNSIPQSRKEQDGHISSTTLPQNQRHRILNNSFDIMNPLVIDESNPADQKKIKQPPMVFRSGTREVHNKLEKHRRAHLKECFDILKKQLPINGEEKKTSNLSILHSSLRCIQTLKRRERDLEHEMERLAREKISYQQRLAILKKDSYFENVDFTKILSEIPSNSTSIRQNGSTAIQSNDIHTSGTSQNIASTTVINTAVAANIVISGIGTEATRTEPSTTSVCSGEMGNINGSTVQSVGSSTVINQPNSVIATNGESKISIPILSKPLPIVTTTQAPGVPSIKEVTQPVQTAGISVLPMPYPVNQGLVLQKVAIVPHKGLTDLTPLVSTHFITPQQLNGINGQLNGKVVPLTQYVMKPVVVVSTASPRPGS